MRIAMTMVLFWTFVYGPVAQHKYPNREVCEHARATFRPPPWPVWGPVLPGAIKTPPPTVGPSCVEVKEK